MLLTKRLVALFMVLWLSGCANIVPPDGGEKDVVGPKLLRIEPADSSLNIQPKKLELWFDEFVRIEDAANQVQISPLLRVPPTLTVKAKKVTLTIPDTLLSPNTTYTISLGTAIKDIHEGNPAPDLVYLFSTGAYFDSLSLRGKILNARTGKPDSAAKVLLYPAKEGRDAIVKVKPSYVTTTFGDGSFIFKGLPAGEFRIFALRETNNNFTFDAAEEWIAFDDQLYNTALIDSIPTLFLFQEDRALVLTTGKTAMGEGVTKKVDRDKKQLSYTVQVDTLDASKGSQDLTAPLEIRWIEMPAQLEHARMVLSFQQNGVEEEAIFDLLPDSLDKNNLWLRTEWRPGLVYTLRLMKGFAKDSSGQEALPGKFVFKTMQEADYAQLQVIIPRQLLENELILEVYSSGKLVKQNPLSDSTITLNRLKPGKYTIQLIVDKNKNGRWDTGNFKEGIQPEKIIPFQGEESLRAGWTHLVDFLQPKNQKP